MTVREYLKGQGFTRAKSSYTEIGENSDCYWQLQKDGKWKSIKLSKEIAERAFTDKLSMDRFLATPIANLSIRNTGMVCIS